MQPNVVGAQAETLREWSDNWSREATVSGRVSAQEVSDALARAAALMLDDAGLAPQPYSRVVQKLAAPPHVERVRGE